MGAALRPLAEALRQQPVLQAEKTALLLLNPEKGNSQKGYLWAYVSPAGADRAVVLYDCQQGRSGGYARAMLADWQGTLAVDGYAGYRVLFDEAGVKEGAAGRKQQGPVPLSPWKEVKSRPGCRARSPGSAVFQTGPAHAARCGSAR